MSTKVRWMRFAGEISDAERDRVRASTLYRVGDTILVWVNEGDILMHENMEPNFAERDLTKMEAWR